MKVLKFLGVLVLILVLAVVVIGLIAPKDVSLERSVMIKGPKEAVFAQMVNFKQWTNWSPFYKADTTTVMDYFGTDGQQNSGYTYKSEQMGEGTITNTGVNGTEMKYNMVFVKPFEATAWGYLRAEDAGNGETKATWTYNTHNKFPMNALWMIFTGKMLGKEFSKGLEYLKEVVESGKVTATTGNASNTTVDIKETTFPGGYFATIRKTIPWTAMEAHYNTTYTAIDKEAHDRIQGNPMAITYLWDEKSQQMDIAPGYAVKGKEPVKGATMVDMKATPSLMAVHKGGYASSMTAHFALSDKLKAMNKQQGLVIEEYVVGPADNQDTTQWVTNIYYLLQ